jgi:hypothetical protein
MGCNCNKNKNVPTPEQVKAAQDQPQFRKQEIQEQSLVKKKMSMLQSFATAIASRGIQDNKVEKPIKQLRVLSCFGNQDHDGVLPPCEHLKESTTPGKHFCGGCGCGDKEGTWLVSDGEKYSKLDYPKLTCPLAMPGFSNYQHSKEDEGVDPVTRRWYIENKITFNEMNQIPVTTHAQPQQQPKQ